MRRFLLAAALVLFAAPLFSESDPRKALVVTAPWLAAHIKDANLVLLHVGEKEEYQKAHLPGARHITLRDLSVSDHSGKGLMLEMPPADDLRARLEGFGISDKSRVIVYYGKDWVSPATRIIFTLDYAGLGDRASLLDGGQDAWVRNGGKVTDVVPAAKKGTLAPLQIRPIVVDAQYVHDHIGKPGISVIDGRSESFYDGVEIGDSMGEAHRMGHIAGAHSVPFTSITDDQLMLRSKDDLVKLFANAGVKPGDTVIGYCHIGQQATAMLFAARTLGYPVMLYDGSFEDWSRHKDYAVEAPAKGSK